MYIIKNALRCVGRSKGRSILIGIIALVIAVSACIGLSIRQAAETAKVSALEGMSVTATISYDRAGAMNKIGGDRASGDKGQEGGFDRDLFADMMSGASALTLEEYRRYASAESVQDFYYTLTAYFNGSDSFFPVSDETADDEEEDGSLEGGNGSVPGMPGGMNTAMPGAMATVGDFTIIGYSSDSAMTSFISGGASVTDGAMFDEGTDDYTCVISEELAVYNDLAVGDTVIITNPSLETETYILTISGIYSNTEANDLFSSEFGTSQDPANRIYLSANALQAILDVSEAASVPVADESTGNEKESAIGGTIAATYVFADTDAYYAFEEEVRTLGLDDSYTVSSADITAFETGLAPLNTLSTMAGWFLLVILIIGGVILVVLNIFNVRERKYEVGVLTAMGMKKWKVAAQFVCEILIVTMLAVLIGVVIGAVSSVPVTNALLETQVESQNSQQMQTDQNFGRPGNMGNGAMGSEMPLDPPSDVSGDGGAGNARLENMLGGAADYITEVHSAMDLTVVLQMIGVGLLLTLVASAASVLFIMRYDPLKILANRD